MKSITYIISNIDKAVAFEWIIREINAKKFKLSFILLNMRSTHLERFIKDAGLEVFRIAFQSKKDYPKAIIATRKKLLELKSDTVHCHMRDANFIGLLAAKLCGINKRIYTRHFSTYNHKYYPKAVKIDRLINKWSTDIIAISKNVESILIEKENVEPEKISLIYHGFDLNKFKNPKSENISALAQKYNPENNSPVIGVIARFIEWKGHKYIIEAFYQILQKFPNALFVFANARGPQRSKISQWIKEAIPNNSIEIEFEDDLFSLYKLFDVYVHTPINEDIEAFGQTYVEALASGVPSIFTQSGIATEFIRNEYNALTVPFQNSEKITEAVLLLLSNEKLRTKIVKNGTDSIAEFALSYFINKLENLYA